jgi:hypothetical protein
VSAADLVWRPTSTPPVGRGLFVSVLILLPEEGLFSGNCLDGQLYTWNGNRQAFIGDDDGEQLKGEAWWLAEEDLLALTRAP